MSTSKKLNTDQITNELAEGSVFFQRGDHPPSGDEASGLKTVGQAPTPVKTSENPLTTPSGPHQGKPSSTIASAPASRRASTHESSLASFLAESNDLVEAIYRTVKRPGRDTSYVRMTEREKTELTRVIGSLGHRRGYRISETEVMRIALCILIAEYTQKGDESLFAKVIAALKE